MAIIDAYRGKTEVIKKKLVAVFTAMLIFFMFAVIYASTQLTQPGKPVNRVTPSIESTGPESYFQLSSLPQPLPPTSSSIESAGPGPESYFQVKIAYAYVGPLPPEKASYVDPKTNKTMVHVSNYPSAVFLDFTAIPSMTGSCDAVIVAYGVKIVADTGPTEYYAWSVGTANYSVFTPEDFATLTRYIGDILYPSTYRAIGGTFSYNWAADKSILSHTIGSVGTYSTNNMFTQSSLYGLSSGGIPNAISVEVYQLAYITMTNGSVTIHEDTVTDNKPVAYAQLSNYEGGFIYNNIVPTEQLPQIDLFHPTS
jgi:hypothetical protein